MASERSTKYVERITTRKSCIGWSRGVSVYWRTTIESSGCRTYLRAGSKPRQRWPPGFMSWTGKPAQGLCEHIEKTKASITNLEQRVSPTCVWIVVRHTYDVLLPDCLNRFPPTPLISEEPVIDALDRDDATDSRSVSSWSCDPPPGSLGQAKVNCSNSFSDGIPQHAHMSRDPGRITTAPELS